MFDHTDESRGALARLSGLDACVVSDTLDFFGLPGATIGLRPLWPGPRIIGRALTVQVVPRTDGESNEHLNTAAIEAGTDTDIIVVANGGRMDVSCWGDILSNAAARKGIRGVVIDGACRDIDACSDVQFPVFGRAVVPVSARTRIVQESCNKPVVIAGVRVEPGDYLVADGSGTVFIPKSRVYEVIEVAAGLATKQHRMVEAVKAGRSVVDVMHDCEFASALPNGASS